VRRWQPSRPMPDSRQGTANAGSCSVTAGRRG